MPSGISGVRTTDGILAARRVVDMAPKIVMLEDDRKSLMTFLGALNTRKVKNPKFNWLTDEIVPKADAVDDGTGMTDSDTAMVVDNGQYFTVNDIIKIPRTGETCLVTAVSGDTLTITRSWGTVAAAAIVDNDPVLRIGNAYSENSTLRDSSNNLYSATTVEVDNYNYVQTFRDAFGLSRREQGSELYGGDDRSHQRMKKLLEHCEKINLAFWHGERQIATNRTTTGGLLEVIPSANTEAIATLTETELEDFLRANTRYGGSKSKGGKRKTLFCSRFVNQVISAFARDNQRVTNPGGSIKYGVHATEYHSGTGAVIDIVTDHALEGAVYNGYAALVDPSDMALAQFGDEYMKLHTDLQENDRDGVVDEYRSDVGLQSGEARHHGLITGVTA